MLMKLRCRMLLAFFLLLYSHGLDGVQPHAFSAHPAKSNGSNRGTLSENTTPTQSQISKTLSKPQWECPRIVNMTGVTCLCDVPHTVRCRGALTGPQTLFLVLNKLIYYKNQYVQISLLDIAIQNIKSLPPHTFDGLYLLGLIISGAGLESISKDSFLGLETNLTALGLPSNKLKTVTADALEILQNLEKLDLSENQITLINTHEFPRLVQLQNLNLAGNGLRSIEPEAFARVPQLKTLLLSRNQLDITQVNGRAFWGLRSLSVLSLQANLLKGTLGTDFLPHVPKLTTLDLSHNAITKITLGALQNCKSLKTFDLSYNNIDIIEDHAFRHLSKLQKLDLSHNQIISVSGWSLAHLPNLNILNFADNALFAVTADLLHQLPNLTSLDLTANDITLLQPDVFSYTPSLSKLSLADNPLHCDCAVTWLWKLLKNNFSMNGKDKSGTVCTTPPTLENAPLIDLNITDLRCVKDFTDYYHDEGNESEPDELYDFRLSNAEISLQAAGWVGDLVQLVWHIDQRAVPYTCQALHIYEIETIMGSVHQILTEKLDVNCSSEDQIDPHQIVVTVPSSVILPGSTYRYCLVLLERGTNDDEGFLPGCSDALLLNDPSSEKSIKTQETKVSSLTVGNLGMSLVVQTRVSSYSRTCSYYVYVITGKKIAASRHLNCSEARHSFSSLKPGHYIICAIPDIKKSGHITDNDLRERLANSLNTTVILSQTFPICSTINLEEETRNFWTSEPLIILLFTLPGLGLMVTLYVIGRRVWKGGGRSPLWRWDSRTSKGAKYFLYTGENITPSASFDPLPDPESSV